MARRYELTTGRRFVNRAMTGLLSHGLAPKANRLLTVQGRRTGKPHSTPVTLVIDGSQRWLVAPYGEVGWVRNARAAGQVTLSRGRHAETVRIAEVDAETAAPVLQQYAARVPITRPYFDAGPKAPIGAFVVEAGRHPVFQIVNPPVS
jgi:deazaflavin-dependent oxidoreductase (nitroreductase family)